MASLIFPLSVFGFLVITLAKLRFRYKYTVIIQFAIGALIIELAWFHALVNLIFMTMAIGDANNWGLSTVLGFALCAFNAFLLWVIHNRSLEEERSMKKTFATTYGEDYLKRIHPDRLALVKKGPSRHQWLKPFRLKANDMETISGIAYGDHIENTLTVYKPKNPPETPMPVMLQIHGGGWIISYSDRQALPLRNKLVAANWIFVSINYRLSPTFKFPDHLTDCKKALLWIKENIVQYGGDPDFIMSTGGSAGGHLSSLLTLTENKATDILQPGFEDANMPEIKACIPMYGIYDFTDSDGSRKNIPIQPFLESTVMPSTYAEAPDLWKLASPIWQLDDNRPPFLVMHGVLDTLAFVESTRSFVKKAQETSTSSCVYIEIPLAQHAFDLFYSPHCISSIKIMHIFSEIIYADYLDKKAMATI